MKRVLVTGANGFVGRAVCARLAETAYSVRSIVRFISDESSFTEGNIETHAIGEIGPDTRWEQALSGVESVVHLAARAHVLEDVTQASLAEYRRVNVDGTAVLARAAARAGVRRFVYLSSVKVNGEITPAERPFTETDKPNPQDPYGQSKWEAEQILSGLAADTRTEVVILRPPLVYGPGVKANFLALLRLVHRGLPLPFGAIDNRRSFLYVGNLADAVSRCLEHPQAAGRTFLVADGEVSVPELIRRLARAFGKTPRLLPFPPVWLNRVGRLLGKSAAIERLTSSLVMDSTMIRRVLEWNPPFSMDEGLRTTCDWYSGEYGRLKSPVQ